LGIRRSVGRSIRRAGYDSTKLVLIVSCYDPDQDWHDNQYIQLQDEQRANRFDESSSRPITGAVGLRKDSRGVGRTDFASLPLPRSDLNAPQITFQQIPSLAVTASSQYSFGHLGVGLMKVKVTPANVTDQRSDLGGFELGHQAAALATTLQRVSHDCVLFVASSTPKARQVQRRQHLSQACNLLL
jgi:hypothetical protein